MSNAQNPAFILAKLIACPSVTPEDGGAQNQIADFLTPLGFEINQLLLEEPGTSPIHNLYAVRHQPGKHLLFAGHSDVVPVGARQDWQFDPFDPVIKDGVLYGRGCVDMKGGIACFIAALARLAAKKAPLGTISLLITGDEEGPAINGTAKMLKWAKDEGYQWDGALVGEPTCVETIGDMAKIGRRGSLSGTLTVTGKQGHVAYPERALNPLPALLTLLKGLIGTPLDEGSAHFPPSNLEITSIDTGNGAFNIIPQKTQAIFNIRFNDNWSVERLKDEILNRLDLAFRQLKSGGFCFEVDWVKKPGDVFLTHDSHLIAQLNRAIAKYYDGDTALSTSGGTSDARFIKDYCPVVEFGLVGKTMHMVDECVPLHALETLTNIYEDFIQNFFSAADK